MFFIVVCTSNFVNAVNRMPNFLQYFFYYFYISIEGNTIRFSYSKFCYERSECTNHEVKIKVTKTSPS